LEIQAISERFWKLVLFCFALGSSGFCWGIFLGDSYSSKCTENGEKKRERVRKGENGMLVFSNDGETKGEREREKKR
jgi:hypothetical protein